MLFSFHRASAVCSVPRLVVCEHCETQYVYLFARRAQGLASTVNLVGYEHADARAVEAARMAILEALRTECDAVPCPACGLYQAHMTEAVRHERRWWAGKLGSLFLGLAPAVIFPIIFAGAIRDWDDSFSLLVAALGAAAMAGIGLSFKAWRHLVPIHPNRWPAAGRLVAARTRAVTRADFVSSALPSSEPERVGEPLVVWARQCEVATGAVLTVRDGTGEVHVRLDPSDRDGAVLPLDRITGTGKLFVLRLFNELAPR